MAVWTLGFGDVSVPVQSFETVVSIFCGSGRFEMMVTIVITTVCSVFVYDNDQYCCLVFRGGWGGST